MSPSVAARAQAMMRLAAAPGPGETRGSALWRAARMLGITRGVARALLYAELEAVSDSRAEEILAHEDAVLRARLRQLTEETAALQARLLPLPESECAHSPNASSPTNCATSSAGCSRSSLVATVLQAGSSLCASASFAGLEDDSPAALARGACP